MENTIYREIFGSDIFWPLSLLLSEDESRMRRILISQTISLFTQLCLGEFTMGLNHYKV